MSSFVQTDALCSFFCNKLHTQSETCVLPRDSPCALHSHPLAALLEYAMIDSYGRGIFYERGALRPH